MNNRLLAYLYVKERSDAETDPPDGALIHVDHRTNQKDERRSCLGVPFSLSSVLRQTFFKDTPLLGVI